VSVDLAAVCVFCGSNRGVRPEYEQAARDVGHLLAGPGIRLVYGGAGEGLMGIVVAPGGAMMTRAVRQESFPHRREGS
jgi:predicted Rossmann-fold nucleotide-binding protein